MTSLDLICQSAVEGRSEFHRAGAARFATAHVSASSNSGESARFMAFRRARGWTQERMAREIGRSQPTLSRWERGATPAKVAQKLLSRYELSGYGLHGSGATQAVPS